MMCSIDLRATIGQIDDIAMYVRRLFAFLASDGTRIYGHRWSRS
jgi:hypothetical protein